MPDVGVDCLVRSTDFAYRYEQSDDDPRNLIHSIMTSVTQFGYQRKSGGGYHRKSMPPVEFDYSRVVLGTEIRTFDSDDLENLPYGVDGTNYRWVDLDGEGLSGTLTEQGGAWHYKRNESPLTRSVENDVPGYTARLGPRQVVGSLPGGGLTGAHRRQFLDLAGDGQLDVVELEPPLAGFFERGAAIGDMQQLGWKTFARSSHCR